MSDTPRLIPILQTARLRLRAPSLADFPASLAMWSNPDVTRFIGGRPNSKEEVWGRLLRYIGHWQAIGYGYWIIESAADGAAIGEAGLGDYRRDISPPFDGVPEIGWVLTPHASGKGIATEAASAILAWRDSALPPGPTMCLMDLANAASLRVATKLGFHIIAESQRRGEATLILRRDRPEHSDLRGPRTAV
jgi:RimJ/RimL family protein N-acetyltransferase